MFVESVGDRSVVPPENAHVRQPTHRARVLLAAPVARFVDAWGGRVGP